MSQVVVIYCPTSDKPITRQYTSLKQARKVRDKMSAANPGKTFHIMLSVPENVLDMVIGAGQDIDKGE